MESFQDTIKNTTQIDGVISVDYRYFLEKYITKDVVVSNTSFTSIE